MNICCCHLSCLFGLNCNLWKPLPICPLALSSLSSTVHCILGLDLTPSVCSIALWWDLNMQHQARIFMQPLLLDILCPRCLCMAEQLPSRSGLSVVQFCLTAVPQRLLSACPIGISLCFCLILLGFKHFLWFLPRPYNGHYCSQCSPLLLHSCIPACLFALLYSQSYSCDFHLVRSWAMR